jgi:hypothetical protein
MSGWAEAVFSRLDAPKAGRTGHWPTPGPAFSSICGPGFALLLTGIEGQNWRSARRPTENRTHICERYIHEREHRSYIYLSIGDTSFLYLLTA